MENRSLRKYLILGLLITFSLIGVLSGCGRKEYQRAKNEYDRQQLFIRGELQWESCFGWQYSSLDESADGDKIGYFVQEGKIVEVWHDVLSEEDFFMLINSRARELTEKYPEEEVVYRINGSTEVDQFVQLDTDKEHQLYIRNKDGVYIFYSEMDSEGWQNFWEEWLFASGLNWDGEIYEMLDCGKSDGYDAVFRAKIQMGYNDYSFFSWTQDEDGSVSQFDLLTNTHFYRKDLGGGEVIRILAERTEETSEEAGNDDYYRVRIYDEKKNELLQELQVYSIETERSPFVFEDFNADGYLDLTVIDYYAAHNTPEHHYIFSPSKREFVKLDSELDYGARVDYETRRMYFHFHFLESYGLEVTYQWKNEMDYEVVKRFLHDGVKDGVLVEISRYENGREEILSDYIYSYEEYEERDDIWGTYYEDFIWEKEVTDKSTGKKYMIRYAEVFLPEEAKKNGGIYYDGRIYVYDEDTYLVSVTHSEIASESKSIEWEDGGRDKEQALVIHYADGGESTFYLSELIQPDYQPDEQ